MVDQAQSNGKTFNELLSTRHDGNVLLQGIGIHPFCLELTKNQILLFFFKCFQMDQQSSWMGTQSILSISQCPHNPGRGIEPPGTRMKVKLSLFYKFLWPQ